MGKHLAWQFALFGILGGVVLWRWPDTTGCALAAGIILLHFVIAGIRRRWRFPEDDADSVYFLGFLFTVALLATSFLFPDASARAVGISNVLAAVGRGLLLTVWGLFLRQLATLMNPPVASAGDESTPVAAEFSPGTIAHGHDDPAMQVAEQEIAQSVRELKRVASQVSAAAESMTDASRSLELAAAEVLARVQTAGGHIEGAATQAAGAIATAAGQVVQGLTTGVGEMVVGYDAARSNLEAQGKALVQFASESGAANQQALERVVTSGRQAMQLADDALRAAAEASRVLTDRANAMPDPGEPTRKFAASIAAAAESMESARADLARTADTLRGAMKGAQGQVTALGSESAAVLDSAQQALERARSHFALFARLEDEYITLVEKVARRGARE